VAAIVSIHEIRTYDPERVAAAVRACLDPLGGIGAFVQAGQTVLLKPNLLQGASPEKAVTTHPAVVRAMIDLCREAGARVWVGDNPGYGDPIAIARKAGILAAVQDGGAEWIDLTETRVFEAPENRLARRIELPSALAQVDAVITLPKLKTHGQLTFTGAVKNQFGLIPGTRKARYHYRLQTRIWLARLIVDINRIAHPALAVMDGIVGMEGQGPSGGRPREVGVLLAGADLSAVDAIACHLVGIDARSVPTLTAAEEVGYGITRLEEIEVRGGDLDALRLDDFERVSEIASVLRILPLPEPAQHWIRRQWQPRPRIRAEACIRCNACAEGCPVDPAAIDPAQAAGGGTPKHASGGVDDASCIRCYCCHEFCPVQAIDLVPGRWAWVLRPLERL
jgi:uncharacterized protein (DUF362 family)/NAD-dependent dihydropyrimidine dehydrogenase PreA subunit